MGDSARAPRTCTHPDREELSMSRGVAYLRCRRCGAVIVSSRDRAWVVPAAQG